MPEPVELRVRGGERRRVPVAEADDGDAAGEVEEACGRRRRSARSPRPDERDVRARVGRQDGATAMRCAHATTSVIPISARTPSRAASTAARSLGTIPPSKRSSPSSAIGVVGR